MHLARSVESEEDKADVYLNYAEEVPNTAHFHIPKVFSGPFHFQKVVFRSVSCDDNRGVWLWI